MAIHQRVMPRHAGRQQQSLRAALAPISQLHSKRANAPRKVSDTAALEDCATRLGMRLELLYHVHAALNRKAGNVEQWRQREGQRPGAPIQHQDCAVMKRQMSSRAQTRRPATDDDRLVIAHASVYETRAEWVHSGCSDVGITWRDGKKAGKLPHLCQLGT